MRTVVFIDGQNLFHLAKRAWAYGHPPQSSLYDWPSYDVEKLANALVYRRTGRFNGDSVLYRGSRSAYRQRRWHWLWSNKLRMLSSRGIYVFRGQVGSGGQEKGVDVSLAIDLVRATYEQRYEVAMIVSQGRDFGPAVQLAKDVALGQGRSLIYESCFPLGHGSSSRRGIPGTDWMPIDKSLYDSCIDPRDYRLRP